MSRNKVCIVATNGQSLYNFRGRLISEFVNYDYEVTCISIEDKEEIEEKMSELGARYLQVAGNRTGIGIFDSLRMIKKYFEVFRTERPDICFLYMSKPIAFGGIAAGFAGIKHINILVNGLENAFYRKSLKDAVVRIVMRFFYRIVSAKADNVFFQNQDDLSYFTQHKLLLHSNASVVGGSGVDMEHFKRVELPNDAVVLMIARLLWSKGIREFLSAIKIVKKDYPNTKVLLVGGYDENDEAISKEEIEQLVETGLVEYCGFTNDVRTYISRCSIFVLPSYHEGLPRSVIEAMAMGRPIITTNVPGCRETVVDGVNGFLVPDKNVDLLADRIIYLIKHSDERRRMGDNSYRMCKEKFEVSKVNQFMMKKMIEKEENNTLEDSYELL